MALERVYLKKGFAEVDALLDETSPPGEGGRLALTDANEGSVVRTLAEAFARELAVCYEQLDACIATPISIPPAARPSTTWWPCSGWNASGAATWKAPPPSAAASRRRGHPHPLGTLVAGA
jgi:hypothetical protein